METRDLDLTLVERAVRDCVIMILPQDGEDNGTGYTDEEEKFLRSILAQEYVEHGRVGAIVKIVGLLFIFDSLFFLQPVIYGLMISAYGALFSAVLNIHTPLSLDKNIYNEAKQEEKRLRMEVKNSVKMNIIAVALGIGFIIQIAGVTGVLGAEVVTTNILEGDLPGWLIGVGIFVGLLSFPYIKDIFVELVSHR